MKQSFSPASIVSLTGAILAVTGLVSYFNDATNLSVPTFFYGVPILLIGLAMKKSELAPVKNLISDSMLFIHFIPIHPIIWYIMFRDTFQLNESPHLVYCCLSLFSIASIKKNLGDRTNLKFYSLIAKLAFMRFFFLNYLIPCYYFRYSILTGYKIKSLCL